MKKIVKTIYSSAKVSQCPRCKNVTKQTLFDYCNLIYKCTKCGNIHA